jgi:hypothetical protein
MPDLHLEVGRTSSHGLGEVLLLGVRPGMPAALGTLSSAGPPGTLGVINSFKLFFNSISWGSPGHEAVHGIGCGRKGNGF